MRQTPFPLPTSSLNMQFFSFFVVYKTCGWRLEKQASDQYCLVRWSTAYWKFQNLPVKSMQFFYKFLEEYLLNCARVGCDSRTWTTSANRWTRSRRGFCLFSICSPTPKRKGWVSCVYYSVCFSVCLIYDWKTWETINTSISANTKDTANGAF